MYYLVTEKSLRLVYENFNLAIRYFEKVQLSFQFLGCATSLVTQCSKLNFDRLVKSQISMAKKKVPPNLKIGEARKS